MVSSADTIFFSLCCLDNLESHPAISALEILVLSWKEERQGTFFSLFPKSEDFVFSVRGGLRWIGMWTCYGQG